MTVYSSTYHVALNCSLFLAWTSQRGRTSVTHIFSPMLEFTLKFATPRTHVRFLQLASERSKLDTIRGIQCWRNVGVMWAELVHSHFFVRVSNQEMLNCVLWFVFSIQWRYYCNEFKPILYLDAVYCKVSLRVEINPYSCEQTLVI